MKTFLTTLLGLCLVPALFAQEPAPEPAPAPPPAVRLQQEDLNTLLGPIALYPDPLIALILPASTFPSDLVMAARFADSGADPAELDNKPWDDSVKGMVRYPDTLKWMDENLEWTTQLGETYLAQPEDVMNAIQDLRQKAKSVGNLVDTPEQRIVDDVVEDRSYVRIVPAQPEYIYVPEYDPEIIYYERPIERPLLTFSAGFLVGSWLSYDFDWHRHRLYCGDWHRDRGWDYHHHRDHDRSRSNVYINNNITNYRVWNSNSSRRVVNRTSVTVNNTNIRNNTNITNNNTNITRNNTNINGNNNIANRRRGVALPSRFTDRSRANGETVRRAVTSNNPSLGGGPRGPGNGFNDRNHDGRNDNDPRSNGNGRFALPNSSAPFVKGDGRPGTGGPNGSIANRNRDGRDGDRNPNDNHANGPDGRRGLPGPLGSKNIGPDGKPRISGSFPNGKGHDGRPDVKKPTNAPDVKDFLPDGSPRGSNGVAGGGRNGPGMGKGGDLTNKNRGDNLPEVRRPDIKDLTPGGPNKNGKTPLAPGITKNGKEPKGADHDNRTPEVRRPNVKDFVPGPRPQSPGSLSDGGRRDSDSSASDDLKLKNRGDNKPNVARPQVMRPPQVKNVNPGSGGVNAPKTSAPKISPPKARSSSSGGDGPRRPSPSISPSKPRAETSMPKPQIKRDTPPSAPKKVMPSPVHREAPKPKASPAPVHKEAPKAMRQSAPKPKVSAPVHREASKPKPHVSAPRKSSPTPKPHVSAPKPKSAPAKPHASPAKKSSASDDRKKKKH